MRLSIAVTVVDICLGHCRVWGPCTFLTEILSVYATGSPPVVVLC